MELLVAERFNTVLQQERLYDFSNLKTFTEKKPEFIEEYLMLFRAELSKTAKAIEVAYAQKDLQAIKFLAHKYKPSVQYLNIKLVGSIIHNINYCCLSQTCFEDCKEQIEQLIDIFKILKSQINEDLALMQSN